MLHQLTVLGWANTALVLHQLTALRQANAALALHQPTVSSTLADT
jgi:hypothetical protein